LLHREVVGGAVVDKAGNPIYTGQAALRVMLLPYGPIQQDGDDRECVSCKAVASDAIDPFDCIRCARSDGLAR
jgi:hypothetical protein